VSKQSYEERFEALERQNADLLRRIHLLELAACSERRERVGITMDEVRATWLKDAGITRPEVPPYGSV
jgi:hypothetical protein